LDKIQILWYKKSERLNIKSVTLILKYGFVFYALGNIISSQNYGFIKGMVSGKKIEKIDDEVKFDQVISFGFFTISLFIAMQMSFKKIVFRSMICLYERSDKVMS